MGTLRFARVNFHRSLLKTIQMLSGLVYFFSKYFDISVLYLDICHEYNVLDHDNVICDYFPGIMSKIENLCIDFQLDQISPELKHVALLLI